MNNSDVGLNDVGGVVLKSRQDWISTQVQLKFESKTIFPALAWDLNGLVFTSHRNYGFGLRLEFHNTYNLQISCMTM